VFDGKTTANDNDGNQLCGRTSVHVSR